VGTLQLEENVEKMDIEELGNAICSHPDPFETSHSGPCIHVSSDTYGTRWNWFTYGGQYAWSMHNKDNSTIVETCDVVSHLLEIRKELGVEEMLVGILGPCNKSSYIIP